MGELTDLWPRCHSHKAETGRTRSSSLIPRRQAGQSCEVLGFLILDAVSTDKVCGKPEQGKKEQVPRKGAEEAGSAGVDIKEGSPSRQVCLAGLCPFQVLSCLLLHSIPTGRGQVISKSRRSNPFKIPGQNVPPPALSISHFMGILKRERQFCPRSL